MGQPAGLKGQPWWLRRASPQGFDISSADRSTGVECPRPECELEVVYNGNYFCECGWALAADVDPARHKGMQEWLDQLKGDFAQTGTR